MHLCLWTVGHLTDVDKHVNSSLVKKKAVLLFPPKIKVDSCKVLCEENALFPTVMLITEHLLFMFKSINNICLLKLLKKQRNIFYIFLLRL